MTRDEIIKVLSNIKDPDLHRDIVSLGFVKKVEVTDSKVNIEIQLTTPACPVRDEMKSQAVDELRKFGFNGEVNVVMTSQVVSHANQIREQVLPGVKNTIAVASGKGGVGKSTVAVNLAAALAKDGAKVGIVDADVYGPSLPLMLGVTEKPETERIDEKHFKIYPVEKFGIKMMSIGFLVDTETPMIWRGPMASGAVKQFLTDVIWKDLDYMIFDLPPGYRRCSTNSCANDTVDRRCNCYNTAGCFSCRCETRHPNVSKGKCSDFRRHRKYELLRLFALRST